MAELEETFGCAGDRGVRHDGGVAPDGDEPAAAGRPQARLRRARAPASKSRSWTTTGSLLDQGKIGEVVIKGGNVTAGLREQPDGQRVVLHGRLVPHRRPGLPRPGRLPLPDGTHQGDHQPRRREGQPARGGRGAAGAPGGGAGRRVRGAARPSRRGGRGRRRAARRRRGGREGAADTPRSSWPTSRRRRRIVILQDIPKGATGKIQRIGLAEKLGLVRRSEVATSHTVSPARAGALSCKEGRPDFAPL